MLVGWLSQARSRLRFDYGADEVDRRGLGRPIVSMSMPTSARPYNDRAARPFFDGLLPEGEARRIIAYDLGTAEADTFGLLEAIGRDCAGALSVVIDGDRPPRSDPRHCLLPLDRDAIEHRISNLRFNPLGIDGQVRVSLGGVQEKLLLTSLAHGRWGLPTAEVASTHILKPAVAGLDDVVVNEAACLRFAALTGVAAASATVEQLGARPVLVVKRFDREIEASDHVRRFHQETACQALAVPVASIVQKYEDAGGPSLAAVAALLRRWARPDQLAALLAQTTVNILVGNADAHAMNTSFLLGDDGVTVAPLYDVFSTVAYPQLATTPGMFVANVKDIGRIGRHHLLTEAESWGMSKPIARNVVEAICTRAFEAMQAAVREFPTMPDRLADGLLQRVRTVLETR